MIHNYTYGEVNTKYCNYGNFNRTLLFYFHLKKKLKKMSTIKFRKAKKKPVVVSFTAGSDENEEELSDGLSVYKRKHLKVKSSKKKSQAISFHDDDEDDGQSLKETEDSMKFIKKKMVPLQVNLRTLDSSLADQQQERQDLQGHYSKEALDALKKQQKSMKFNPKVSQKASVSPLETMENIKDQGDTAGEDIPDAQQIQELKRQRELKRQGLLESTQADSKSQQSQDVIILVIISYTPALIRDRALSLL